MTQENNTHYSQKTGHRERGLFAKRERAIQKALTDIEMTAKFPEIFGGVVKPSDLIQPELEVDAENPSEERNHVLVYEENVNFYEADQLRRRGVVFPVEVEEPVHAKFTSERDLRLVYW